MPVESNIRLSNELIHNTSLSSGGTTKVEGKLPKVSDFWEFLFWLSF